MLLPPPTAIHNARSSSAAPSRAFIPPLVPKWAVQCHHDRCDSTRLSRTVDSRRLPRHCRGGSATPAEKHVDRFCVPLLCQRFAFKTACLTSSVGAPREVGIVIALSQQQSALGLRSGGPTHAYPNGREETVPPDTSNPQTADNPQ